VRAAGLARMVRRRELIPSGRVRARESLAGGKARDDGASRVTLLFTLEALHQGHHRFRVVRVVFKDQNVVSEKKSRLVTRRNCLPACFAGSLTKLYSQLLPLRDGVQQVLRFIPESIKQCTHERERPNASLA
jgi:hypothetical protein